MIRECSRYEIILGFDETMETATQDCLETSWLIYTTMLSDQFEAEDAVERDPLVSRRVRLSRRNGEPYNSVASLTPSFPSV